MATALPDDNDDYQEDPLYREIILEHWQNPQNHGTLAKPDLDETGFNPLCGDRIHLTARVRDGVLTDIAFTAEACAIATASASLFTDHIKGLSLDDVRALTDQDVINLLGISLTPARRKCALLVSQTFLQSSLVQ